MAGRSFEQEITSYLHKLSCEQQIRVLALVRSLAGKKPSGVPGSDLLKFAGAIGLEDLHEMENAITEGCEQATRDDHFQNVHELQVESWRA